MAKSVEAAEGVNEPLESIRRPHGGWTVATKSQMPEKMVEEMERTRMVMESQADLRWYILRLGGHPLDRSVEGKWCMNGTGWRYLVTFNRIGCLIDFDFWRYCSCGIVVYLLLVFAVSR